MTHDEVRSAMDNYAKRVGYDSAALRDFLNEEFCTLERGQYWIRVSNGNSPAYEAATGARSDIWAYASSPVWQAK